MINRYEFEILSFVEKSSICNNYMIISNETRISKLTVADTVKKLLNEQLIEDINGKLRVTDKGVETLASYRVKRAIIMGAGFGSRMMPATKDRPKPMVRVNGKRIIETQLDAMVRAGIKDITIVRGYQKDRYNELLDKYPFLKFVDNDDYDRYNNISSVMKVLNLVEDGIYLCEADLYISNPDVISKYQYTSNILGSYSLETDDWSFKIKNGHIVDYQQGNTYCYNYYGISYWTPEDCKKLCEDWQKVYATDNGKNAFWEIVPLVLYKDRYQVEVRQCQKSDIVEIDNYYELMELDKSYH